MPLRATIASLAAGLTLFHGGLCAASGLGSQTSTQGAVGDADVPALVEEAVRYQKDDFHHTQWGLRYRVHRVDGREDITRDLIESADGNIARTLLRNTKPLTPEQDEAEKARLRGMTTAELQKHQHGDGSDRFGLDLIGAMPKAMRYALVPGQPQAPGSPGKQIVLDFVPDPAFHPANTTQGLLTGLAGRLWIDAETHRVVRIDLRVTKNLNVLMGLLIRVYEGGTITYEQRPVGGGHYAYSHIDINVRLRELLVRTVPYHSTFDASDVVYLPSRPSMQEAIDALLADPATVRR